MADEINCNTINFLTKQQYDESDKDPAQLWAIRTEVVIESFHEGTEWHRVWSDGKIEQGGYASFAAAGTAIEFTKHFSGTDYTILWGDISEKNRGLYRTVKTNTGFTAKGWSGTTDTAVGASWYAVGY